MFMCVSVYSFLLYWHRELKLFQYINIFLCSLSSFLSFLTFYKLNKDLVFNIKESFLIIYSILSIWHRKPQLMYEIN